MKTIFEYLIESIEELNQKAFNAHIRLDDLLSVVKLAESKFDDDQLDENLLQDEKEERMMEDLSVNPNE